MNADNVQQAREYALVRLERDLPPGLFYHGMEHTLADVVPAAQALAEAQRLEGESLHLLLTAAWFHDLGFIEARVGHEAVSARLASEVLPGLGYSEEQVRIIRGIIGATVLPQSPATILEQILADADLDVLGRDDFMPRTVDLRRELAFFGQESTDLEWYRGQLKFVQAHTYFTASARARRDAGKAKNIADLKGKLAEMDERA